MQDKATNDADVSQQQETFQSLLSSQYSFDRYDTDYVSDAAKFLFLTKKK